MIGKLDLINDKIKVKVSFEWYTSLTSFCCILNIYTFTVAAAKARVKRQDDDGDGETNIDELCHDRPGDEYFRLSTEGDCRDVVR